MTECGIRHLNLQGEFNVRVAVDRRCRPAIAILPLGALFDVDTTADGSGTFWRAGAVKPLIFREISEG